MPSSPEMDKAYSAAPDASMELCINVCSKQDQNVYTLAKMCYENIEHLKV